MPEHGSPKSGAAGFAPAERIPIDVVGAAPKRAVTLGSGEEEVMPPRVRLAAPPSERSLFRREGSYWTIGFRGPSVRLKDTIGLRVPRRAASSSRAKGPPDGALGLRHDRDGFTPNRCAFVG